MTCSRGEPESAAIGVRRIVHAQVRQRSSMSSLAGMTLRSLKLTVQGFLEARVDFDRSRSPC
jgi:hypothetical protein